jgi:hypothetical protein
MAAERVENRFKEKSATIAQELTQAKETNSPFFAAAILTHPVP